ncbi:MAG: molybdopterin-dependent oxidoreductase [Thermacetogeniaceae bacterium]
MSETGEVSQKNKLFTAAVLLLLVIVAVLGYLNYRTVSAARGANPGSAGQILIHGLQGQDVVITMSDLEKLPAVTQHAEAEQAGGEEIQVDATGSLLDTLLEQYGRSQQDFSRIRFTAKDGYSIAVPADILKNRQIILSYINDGKPLEQDWQPVRVVIPGERAMYWVKDMIRIDLETGADKVPATQLVFLDTAAPKLPQESYQDDGSTGKVIRISDLIAKYCWGGPVQNVFIEAADGLEKNETNVNFSNADLEITGQDTPKFLEPGLPEGMTIRDVLVVNYGATAFFDYAEGIRVLPKQTLGSKTGIALSEIIKQTGLAGADDYLFTMADGGSVMVATTDLGSALVYEDADGSLAFTGSGASGPVNVGDLLSIEPVT